MPFAIAMPMAIAVRPTAAVGSVTAVHMDAIRAAAEVVTMPTLGCGRLVRIGRRRLRGRRRILASDSGAGGKAGDDDSENEVAHHVASQCG